MTAHKTHAICRRGRRRRAPRGFVLVTLVCMALLAFAASAGMFVAGVYEEVDLLDDYLSSLPGILDDREAEYAETYHAYLSDCEVRGKLAQMVFEEFEGSATDVRLSEAKDAVSALDLSLVDADGIIVSTTRGDESPELTTQQLKDFLASKKSFADRTLSYGYVPKQKDDEAKQDGEAPASDEDAEQDEIPYPMLFLTKMDEDKTLVAEFDYTAMAKVNRERAAWDSIFSRMLSGLSVSAFVWIDEYEEWTGYPYTEEELQSIEGDVVALFDDAPSFLSATDDEGLSATKYGVGTIQNEPVFVASLRMEERGITALITVPLDDFLTDTFKSSYALAAFLCLNAGLLAWYLRRLVLSGSEAGEGAAGVTTASLMRRGVPGLLSVLIASVGFTVMLVLLEAMSLNASTVTSQQNSLVYELNYNEDSKDRIAAEHRDRSVTRANALARLLSENPQLRTRKVLQRLAGVVGADYLMLFDKGGNELFASNAYTGFVVGKLGEQADAAYAGVLKGHPYALTDPQTDDALGTTTTTVASLVTNDEGLPDGMLVMCVDYKAVEDKLASLSLAGTVGTFSTQDDQVVFAVENESGRIVAHTDDGLVDNLASDYVPETLLGHDFEGFSWYDGDYSYVSESADDVTSVLLVSLYAFDASLVWLFLPLMLVGIVVPLVALYVLAAWRLQKGMAKADAPAPAKSHRFENPLVGFVYAYAVYFCALAGYAALVVWQGGWQSFGFVFSKQWAGGIHLFSLWAALFTASVTLCAVMLIKAVLKRLIGGASAQATTLLRLTDSLVSYAAVIAAFLIVLWMFGVDTTTLLASAGIVSIAIGMGAQSLIADILAGLFIIFEGTVHVGDEVSIAGWSGRVTDMGIRTCKIANDEGDVKIITNSRINDVVNMSQRG